MMKVKTGNVCAAKYKQALYFFFFFAWRKWTQHFLRFKHPDTRKKIKIVENIYNKYVK